MKRLATIDKKENFIYQIAIIWMNDFPDNLIKMEMINSEKIKLSYAERNGKCVYTFNFDYFFQFDFSYGRKLL